MSRVRTNGAVRSGRQMATGLGRLTVLLLCSGMLAACPRKAPPSPRASEPAKPVISPVPNEPPAAAPTDDPTDPTADPGGEVWRHLEEAPDGAAPEADRARDAGNDRARDGAPDVDPEQLAREATDRAINRALDAEGARLTDCVPLEAGQRRQVRVKIRVHRSGYVLSSSVNGVAGEAAACMDRILRQLRVSGVETDSLTVERSMVFERRPSGGRER